MGNLLRETPLSEIVATLEALEHRGISRQDFMTLRSNDGNNETMDRVIAVFRQNSSALDTHVLSTPRYTKKVFSFPREKCICKHFDGEKHSFWCPLYNDYFRSDNAYVPKL